MYESPKIIELGTIADFTRAAGPGAGTDSQFPLGWLAGKIEEMTGWDVGHATS